MAGLSRGQPEEAAQYGDDLVCYLRAQLDGSAYLQACLASHLPVDLVVIMLGSNDLKPVFNRTPLRIAIGAARLIDLACFNRWSRRFTPHVRIREKARNCRCREGEGDFEVDYTVSSRSTCIWSLISGSSRFSCNNIR